jgi:hypothetical protein
MLLLSQNGAVIYSLGEIYIHIISMNDEAIFQFKNKTNDVAWKLHYFKFCISIWNPVMNVSSEEEVPHSTYYHFVR